MIRLSGRQSTRPFLLTVMLALGAGSTSAQTVPLDAAPVGVKQTNPSSPGQAEATGADQIGLHVSPLPTLSAPPDRAIGGSSAPASGAVSYTQVTAGAPSADAGVQLAPDEASAGPAPSATVRAQGRDTATVVPSGPDRCDPQRRQLPVACDRVIEARSNEFSMPDHQPLSAEQRLLATQRELRPGSVDLGTAARRLANGELDDSNAALAVASMALQGPSGLAEEEEEVSADTAAVNAIVSGITSLVTGGVPPNP